jgi:hypothetical protein
MLRVAIFVLSLVFVSGPAFAQAVKQGNLSGTVVSASGTAPMGGTDALILTTPASGAFVLTQICTAGAPGSNNEDNVRVVGSTVGPIAQSYDTGDLGSCTAYTPGLAIPAGEELRCVQSGASGGAASCTVTGVLSKK